MEGEDLVKKYGADCHHLHGCFFGNDSSSDQRKVMVIIAQRNSEELRFIRQTYRALYNQDLLHILSQMSNQFARVVYLRVSKPHDRDAEIIRKTIFSSSSLDLDTLIEIICTCSSLELGIIKETYQARYNTDLIQDVSYKIHGILKEILVAVLSSSRYSDARVDTSMAMCDAKTLYEAISSGQYVDQKCILSILSKRSTSQIKEILSSYKKLYGYEFVKFLKKEKCGEFGRHLCAVIRSIQSPEKQFAKQLRRAVKNGDARETLIRTVVMRAETDIRQINGAFAAKTGQSLESLIRNEFNNVSNSSNDRVADILIALLKHS